MNKILLLGSFLLLSATLLTAQVQDRKHWLVPVDSVEQIRLDIVDEYQVELWPANHIMITSDIKLYGASAGVLTYFVDENGRYDIVDSLQQKELLIQSAQKDRRPIQVQDQTCYENIQVKVYLPDKFVASAEQIWILKPDEEEN